MPDRIVCRRAWAGKVGLFAGPDCARLGVVVVSMRRKLKILELVVAFAFELQQAEAVAKGIVQ